MTPFSQIQGPVGERYPQRRSSSVSPTVKRLKSSINQGLMHVADLMPTAARNSRPPAIRRLTMGEAARALRNVLGNGCWRARRSRHGRARLPRWKSSATARCRQGDWKVRWEYKPFARATGNCYLRPIPPSAGSPAERPDSLSNGTLWDTTSGRTTWSCESLHVRDRWKTASTRVPDDGLSAR